MANQTNRGKVYREVTVVNEEGEVKSQLTESYVNKEPEFIKLYLDDLIVLNQIPKWVGGILFELLKKMQYGTNEIVLNSSVKKRIAEDLNIVPKTIDNALVQFVKKSILLRIEPGIYRANPYLFGKGNWEDIRRIRLTVVYDRTGKYMDADTVNIPEIFQGFNGPPMEGENLEEIPTKIGPLKRTLNYLS